MDMLHDTDTRSHFLVRGRGWKGDGMTTPEQKALKHPEPEQRRACMRCIWWQARNSVIGQCRRMPPSRPEGEAAGFWPMTGRADWCGEYLEGDRA